MVGEIEIERDALARNDFWKTWEMRWSCHFAIKKKQHWERKTPQKQPLKPCNVVGATVIDALCSSRMQRCAFQLTSWGYVVNCI